MMAALHRGSRTPPTNRLVPIVVSGLALLAIATFLIFSLGRVQGVEFAPRTFERRGYTFFQIPGLGFQITPVWRNDVTDGLERYVRKQGWLARGRGATRWDVVWVQDTGKTRYGDPIILARYLDMPLAQNDQRWLGWSRDHPELASALWSAVQRAAMLDAYVLLPDLFELAKSADEIKPFRESVAKQLSEGFSQLSDERSDTLSKERIDQLREAANEFARRKTF